MGVPVVTLAGETHVSRVGASLLTAVGLPELVAASTEGYIAAAVALAGDAARLAALREGMRGQMKASRLMDQSGFAAGVEDALKKMWSGWLNGQPRALAAVG
jgi:predicted O-linked N-acetylglucosamine transferase (SPINDLY family)